MRTESATTEARYAALCAALPCGVLLLDAAGTILHANETAQEILGQSLESLCGKPAATVLCAEQNRDQAGGYAAVHPVLLALRDQHAQRKLVCEIRRRDNEHCWLELDIAPLIEAGQPSQLVVSFSDISGQRREEEARAYQALHDPLTGLANRTLLMSKLHHILQAAERERLPVALLLMDLDHFKEVNGTLGHQLGDHLLQEIATRVQSMLRAADTVARIGGDEFAMLLPGTDGTGAAQVARRILAVVEMPCILEERNIDIGASIGIASYPEHGWNASTLLQRADVAMYVAKRTGGGYAVYNAAQDQHTLTRLTLLGDLREALTQDHLRLQYQPLLTLPQGHLQGVEALIRWQHPTRGLIMPDQFIPVAEHSGLIGVVSLWVMETALRQSQSWQASGHRLGIAVNLSMRTLHDVQLPDTIAWLLQRYGVPAHLLTLEITESALMMDPQRAMNVLERLAKLGVRLAIDDFGTGYSSLGYLKHLPVHTIKIDKSFVLGMNSDARDSAIVRSTVDLSHNLGLNVVAEGVEHQAAWDLLANVGCDSAQGNYMSRPLSVGEFELWLATTGLEMSGERPKA